MLNLDLEPNEIEYWSIVVASTCSILEYCREVFVVEKLGRDYRFITIYTRSVEENSQ